MNVDGVPHVWLILGFGWQAADEGKHPWTENSSRKLKISAVRLILSRGRGEEDRAGGSSIKSVIAMYCTCYWMRPKVLFIGFGWCES